MLTIQTHAHILYTRRRCRRGELCIVQTENFSVFIVCCGPKIACLCQVPWLSIGRIRIQYWCVFLFYISFLCRLRFVLPFIVIFYLLVCSIGRVVTHRDFQSLVFLFVSSILMSSCEKWNEKKSAGSATANEIMLLQYVWSNLIWPINVHNVSEFVRWINNP